jgi:energy-coupling factor transporter ATP-binding protein EcfA2
MAPAHHPEHATPAKSASALAPVYLRELEVRGLGGIAEAIELELEPRPGLTLVFGPNGAGKSSFVDAVELLLSDRCARWTDALAQVDGWRAHGWRNRSSEAAPRVRGRFAVAREGAAPRDPDHSGAAGDPGRGPGGAATIELIREWFADDLEANELRTTLIGQPLDPRGFVREAARVGPRMFVRSGAHGPLEPAADDPRLSESEAQAVHVRLQLARILAEPSRLGFVIVDDPAPALDPEGIDELAQTLAELAQTHQVLAFTREPRLIDAARGYGARGRTPRAISLGRVAPGASPKLVVRPLQAGFGS